MTTATLAAIVLIGGFIALMLMRVPVSFAMLLSTLGCALVTGTNFSVLVRQMVDGVNNFSLLSIPFFILMGEIMGAGGISDKIIDLARESFTSSTIALIWRTSPSAVSAAVWLTSTASAPCSSAASPALPWRTCLPSAPSSSR